MRHLLLTFLFAAGAFAQPGKFGAFTNSDDVGAPPLKGSAEFDAGTGQYKITGSGADIWAKADNTNTVDFPMEGPGTWKLKLVRQGTAITVWISKDGAPLRELGHTANQLGSPILVGLGVSSHTREAVNTVLFTDVSVEKR